MIASHRLATALDRGSLVKICGLRTPEHAAVAAESGADLLGFIFAPARRRVSVELARECIDAARGAAGDRDIVSVGVFVDAEPAEIEAIARDADLDAAQVNGSEIPSIVAELAVPVIKAFRPRNGARAVDVREEIESFRSCRRSAIGFLIDGFAEGAAGGTGARADWNLAAEVGKAVPVLLAGGLEPGNVASAILHVRPLGVDVSSGVEINGEKSAEQIKAFVQAARLAFAR